ncbi:Poly(ADP-ribose) glycohydrolase [Lamellibrachia satsuma]|nr:Poly(ADP-ribose) glycohydrolase [Lamellibrachia satsuma]
MSHFGILTEITLDHGQQFTSGLWLELAILLGTRLQYTTTYSPQSNSMVERFSRQLETSLKANLQTPSRRLSTQGPRLIAAAVDILEPEDPRLWQDGYVKMPFSQKAQCTVPGRIWPSLETKSKWEVIHEALTKPIVDFIGLKEAILSYNEKDKDLWEFGGLKFFLDEELDNEKRADFFYCVLPKMAELVLSLPQLCSQPIPLLKTGTAHSITMSQEQAACLLANAFFCTFPWHNTGQKQPNYPGFNFNKLYRGPISSKRVGKLKCLLHYFKTVTENMPQGNLTYSRQVLIKDKFPKWKKCPNVFPQLHVSSEGTIEDDGYGMLQVDFANKTIGGGVLGEGSVQEEIRFVICPELIVSLLFTEVLEDNEAVVITGPQRFSSYEGYARSFQWSGDYKDGTPRWWHQGNQEEHHWWTVVDVVKGTKRSTAGGLELMVSSEPRGARPVDWS